MKPILLCLHGWGADHRSFDELRESLKGSGIEILAPDLPGFGSEHEPERALTTDDYAEWVMRWLENHLPPLPTFAKATAGRPNPPPPGEGKRSLSILGHSHGGRIAIKLAAQNNLPIDHLFLCAAAGIKHPRHIKRAIGLSLAKTGKFFLSIPGLNLLQPLGKKLLYKLVRVHDYERASPLMRQTMINVTKEDLRPILKNIRIPTDIFWGEDDGMTPLSDGEYMHTQIKGSHFHVYPNVRHRVHRDKAQEIAEVIRERLS